MGKDAGSEMRRRARVRSVRMYLSVEISLSSKLGTVIQQEMLALYNNLEE